MAGNRTWTGVRRWWMNKGAFANTFKLLVPLFLPQFFQFQSSLCLTRLLVELHGDTCTLYNPKFPYTFAFHPALTCTFTPHHKITKHRTGGWSVPRARRIAEERGLYSFLYSQSVSQSVGQPVHAYDSLAKKKTFPRTSTVKSVTSMLCIHSI